MSYSDLQRQVASHNLKNRNLFIIQKVVSSEKNKKLNTKIFISSDTFRQGPHFQVKEVATPPSRIPDSLPALPTKWDFHNYHGRLTDWIDPALRAQLAAEEEARRKTEEEARAGWEAELKAKEEAAKKAKSDREWQELLGVAPSKK